MDWDETDYTPLVPRLDLGSGPTPAPGYIGVDKTWGDRRIGFDLRNPIWPWADESIEALRSSHLIEHLPLVDEDGRDILVRFFEEAWRICKPGALFRLLWPIPFHPDTGMPVPSAWWDPTHYRRIPYEQVVFYFSAQGRADMGVESYGIHCNWAPTRPPIYRSLTGDSSVLEYDAELRRDPL